MPRFKTDGCESEQVVETGESMFGCYENADAGSVLFTTLGLRPVGRYLIRYETICDARVIGEKHVASSIELTLKNGSVELVRFDGGEDGFRDVWTILRLVDRIRKSID
jgi:hypothetical protein